MKETTDHQNHKRKILAKAIFNACEILDIKEEKIAKIIGIKSEVISQSKEKSIIELTSAETELALLLIRISTTLSNLTNGDVDWINHFMHSHNNATEGTPIKQIENRDGLIKVLTFLEKLNK